MTELTSSPPAYTILSRPSADDSRRAAWLAVGDHRHVFVLFYLLFAALGLALILFAGQVDVLVGAILVLVGAFSIFGTYRPSASLRNRQLWRPDEFTFTFEELGITSASWFSWRSIRWDAITELRSDKQMIVFMRGPSTLTWLPTSAFASQAEMDAVLAFARGHISAAAPKTNARLP